MIIPILLGSATIIVNVIIQAYGTVFWLKRISLQLDGNKKLSFSDFALKLLSFSFILFSILHCIQTLVWASLFMFFPEISSGFESFAEAWYFSLVTFTSLGYGDITLSGNWRLLSGIEAINGIMLIGWSTAMMYSLIQRIFKRVNQ